MNHSISRNERCDITVVYSAVGRAHIMEAAVSAWSAKRVMPGVKTLLIADEYVMSPYFDEVIVNTQEDKDPSRSAKISKIRAIRSASSINVIYADSDTYFLDDVSPIFQDSDRFDIAATHDTWQFNDIYSRINGNWPLDEKSVARPFFNTGVLFVAKSTDVDIFLDKWIAPFVDNRSLKLEQMLFRDAIYITKLRVRVLPSIYNARIGEPLHLSGIIKIVHRRSLPHGPWEKTSPFLAEFINQTYLNRVWIPTEGRIICLTIDFETRSHSIDDFRTLNQKPYYLLPAVEFKS